MSRYGVVEVATGLVVNVILWDGDTTQWQPPEGCIAVQSDEVQMGWSYINEVFVAPPPEPPVPPTEAEILAAQSLLLQQRTQLAAAQKTALSNRIGVLNDGIELGEATPAEIAELPVRQAQLIEWKRYALYLGRVTTQAGWYHTVDWPVQPTAGMDLSVSAVAKTVQAS